MGEAIRQEWIYTPEHGRRLCPHTDEQRGFVCTTSSPELELALDRGYRVTYLYSIYHWEKWSDQLIKPYVQDMIRLKTEVLLIF